MKKIVLVVFVLFSMITLGKEFKKELISKEHTLSYKSYKAELSRSKELWNGKINFAEKGMQVRSCAYIRRVIPHFKVNLTYDYEVIKENVFAHSGMDSMLYYINKKGEIKKQIVFIKNGIKSEKKDAFVVTEYLGRYDKIPISGLNGTEFDVVALRTLVQDDKDKDVFKEVYTIFGFISSVDINEKKFIDVNYHNNGVDYSDMLIDQGYF